jgi:ribosomal protein L7/L12
MDDKLDQVRKLVAGGRLIDAIKLYREATGLGLKEAKEAIDRCAAGGPLEPEIAARDAVQAVMQIDGEIKKLLAAGRKIEAIKVLRHRSGVDLKTAKDIIDSKEADLRRGRGRNIGAAAAVVQRGGGLARWVIIALVVAAGIAAFLLLRSGS